MATDQETVRHFAQLVASNMIRLRRKAKLKQYEFATVIGISKAYLSQIENANRLPSLEMLLKFSHALQVPMTEFVL